MTSLPCGFRIRNVLRDLPSPVLRVLVAFPVVWLWVILAYMGVSLRSIGNLFVWTVTVIASLIYMLLFGVPVCVLLYRIKRTSIIWYLLGALLTGTPIVLVFVIGGSSVGAGYAAFVATIGGIIGYWIVERPSKRSG